jgi:hypothetical protein
LVRANKIFRKRGRVEFITVTNGYDKDKRNIRTKSVGKFKKRLAKSQLLNELKRACRRNKYKFVEPSRRNCRKP